MPARVRWLSLGAGPPPGPAGGGGSGSSLRPRAGVGGKREARRALPGGASGRPGGARALSPSEPAPGHSGSHGESGRSRPAARGWRFETGTPGSSLPGWDSAGRSAAGSRSPQACFAAAVTGTSELRALRAGCRRGNRGVGSTRPAGPWAPPAASAPRAEGRRVAPSGDAPQGLVLSCWDSTRTAVFSSFLIFFFQ
jgi:hypothetical protein